MADHSLTKYLRAMARNNAWSNHRLLEACAPLTPAELEAPRVSFFPSLSLTLNHIRFVDEFYLDALEGRPRAFTEDAVETTVAGLRASQVTADRRLIAFCDALEPGSLDRPVKLIRDAHNVLIERTDRTLAHLFTHQIHHRGQVHAMLAGTQIAPPQLDEFLLATDAPLRAADLAALGFDEQQIWPAE
jgi:uncharacterized damage-inducible protein DinB